MAATWQTTVAGTWRTRGQDTWDSTSGLTTILSTHDTSYTVGGDTVSELSTFAEVRSASTIESCLEQSQTLQYTTITWEQVNRSQTILATTSAAGLTTIYSATGFTSYASDATTYEQTLPFHQFGVHRFESSSVTTLSDTYVASFGASETTSDTDGETTATSSETHTASQHSLSQKKQFQDTAGATGDTYRSTQTESDGASASGATSSNTTHSSGRVPDITVVSTVTDTSYYLSHFTTGATAAFTFPVGTITTSGTATGSTTTSSSSSYSTVDETTSNGTQTITVTSTETLLVPSNLEWRVAGVVKAPPEEWLHVWQTDSARWAHEPRTYMETWVSSTSTSRTQSSIYVPVEFSEIVPFVLADTDATVTFTAQSETTPALTWSSISVVAVTVTTFNANSLPMVTGTLDTTRETLTTTTSEGAWQQFWDAQFSESSTAEATTTTTFTDTPITTATLTTMLAAPDSTGGTLWQTATAVTTVQSSITWTAETNAALIYSTGGTSFSDSTRTEGESYDAYRSMADFFALCPWWTTFAGAAGAWEAERGPGVRLFSSERSDAVRVNATATTTVPFPFWRDNQRDGVLTPVSYPVKYSQSSSDGADTWSWSFRLSSNTLSASQTHATHTSTQTYSTWTVQFGEGATTVNRSWNHFDNTDAGCTVGGNAADMVESPLVDLSAGWFHSTAADSTGGTTTESGQVVAREVRTADTTVVSAVEPVHALDATAVVIDPIATVTSVPYQTYRYLPDFL